MKLDYKKHIRTWRRQMGFMSALLLPTLLTCAAKELPYGVRNAFAGGDPPFLEHSANGSIKKKNLPGRAGIGDELRLEVVNFELWKTNQDSNLRSGELLLYLDRKPVSGLQLQHYPAEDWMEIIPSGDTNAPARTNYISYFGVQLEQIADNLAVWKQLLRSPNFNLVRPMEVSMGYGGGEWMNTWVYPSATVEGKSPFNLVILCPPTFYFGVSVIIGAFFAFVWLARRTDLLRDPSLPLRPDGRMQLSLARTQMAFWFFLVFGAFFFLWLVSRDTDTLNASIITLIGISAGTAVSSAFIDSGKQRPLDESVAVRKELKEKPAAALARLKIDLEGTRQALAKNQNAAQQDSLMEKQKLLLHQIEFLETPLWKVALQDLLGENGVISFHRFQMCVWTVVLGIIFVSDVYGKGAMPEFSATLLGLMGISAGTFIGFKLPTVNPQVKP